jgi:hypothetical protein
MRGDDGEASFPGVHEQACTPFQNEIRLASALCK